MIVESLLSIVNGRDNGLAIRIRLVKEATDDDTLRPEVGILNLLDVTLLDAKLEALEPIMTAWDRFQIHHTDTLILDG